ncbi:hypothetical protein MKW94_020003 [Papaver nudicaule]|uniref:Uncharacterized protein n=1 Tax=Papaver nudicaule TaxID=74823 RepID=A0AA41VTK0_PAPNU|nr:hypothetical protein [Papaver nudicaule]
MESSSIVSSGKGLTKGAWSEEEDQLLRKCIMQYGEGRWGLNRCRKSCRLRWLNYLKPNIKRGEFEPDEVDLIVRMHKLLGRTTNDIKNYYNTHLKKTCFSKYNPKKVQQVILSEKSSHDNNVRCHGQEAQDNGHRQVQKRSHRCLKITSMDVIGNAKHTMTQVLRPQPRNLFKKSQWNINKLVTTPTGMNNNTTAICPNNSQVPVLVPDQHARLSPTNDQQNGDDGTHWLNDILFGDTEEEDSNKKMKKPKKKKKRNTSEKKISLEVGSTSNFGVEEGMLLKDKDGGGNAYCCSTSGEQGLDQEGGNVAPSDHCWNI